MTWMFNGEPFDYEKYKEYFGFVYCITNIENNKKYIGRKYFKVKKTFQKDKKKYKMSVENDWKDYYGSSEKLKEDIEKFGKEKFRRDILILGKTAGVVNFYEIEYQFKWDVLKSDQFYNDNINGKWYSELISTYSQKSLLNEEYKKN